MYRLEVDLWEQPVAKIKEALSVPESRCEMSLGSVKISWRWYGERQICYMRIFVLLKFAENVKTSFGRVAAFL